MIEQLTGRPTGQKRSDHMMRLYACEARVFVKANHVAAGIEALVFAIALPSIPRMVRACRQTDNPNND